MIKNIRSVRGMHDCLPQDAILWRRVENILINILNSYGYNEIRFPIVEFTDLFKHSIGEVTDVVEKEMYDFIDSHNGDHLTLRPEGTSGCVRSGIEHRLFYHQEQRLWYLGPMFRRERPQKGRYRQFHQFSAEFFGQLGPDVDAELIFITARCWKELGINQYISLELNSIGSIESRISYCKKLISFLERYLKDLDDNALRRLYSNPMRILDTKNDNIRKILVDAPVLSDFLDDDSRMHFSGLCRLLDDFNILYTVNPYLVRGLDYYNRTVFEWVTNALGTKKTVCAGGRYDELVKQLGGELIPAIGFSIGLERTILLIKVINNVTILQDKNNICSDIYIISIGLSSKKKSMLLSEHIRAVLPFLRLIVHYGNDNIKKQFICANKNNARIALVIDEENSTSNTVKLKDLQLGNQLIVTCDEIIPKIKLLLNI